MSSVTDLAGLALFEGCAAEDLEGLARLSEVRRIAEGEVLCAEGDKADAWWIIRDGSADVTIRGVYLATVGPGETVGELALLDGEVRGATVTAVTDMVVDRVDGSGFVDALSANPRLAVTLLRRLAARLRATNERAPGPPGPRPATTTARPTDARVTVSRPVQARMSQLDPFVEGYVDDPYSQLAVLRDNAPVHWSAAIRSYVVLRYDDVDRLAHDRDLTGSITSGRPDLPPPEAGSPRAKADRMMIRRDGADHQRLRRLVSKVFTPRAIDRWRSVAESIVEEQLDAAAARGELDVIADYALPLPARVITQMLGLPRGDIAQLRAWSQILVQNLDPLTPRELGDVIEQTGREMFDYLAEQVVAKRAHPADDILSDLVEAEEAGEGLDDEDIAAQVLLLYIAGHETTVNLIGNGVVLLLAHPEQLDRLRTTPDLDANAVEEVLRFDSPAQFTRRITHAPVEVGDITIPADTLITLGLSSANRDPARWGPTAEVFDIARPGANDHLSFGAGPHYCLGASLARLEAKIALPGLVRRFPRLAITADTPSWARRMVLRGLTTLPVTVR